MGHVTFGTGTRSRFASGAGFAAMVVGVFFLASCNLNSPSDKPAAGLTAAMVSAQAKALAPVVAPVTLGTASTFAVMGYAGVTNAGSSVITGDLGVGPGAIAATGFQPVPIDRIVGPGTVTSGLGTVTGTIYTGNAVAVQAHNDAVTAYDYLVAQVPGTTLGPVFQLDTQVLTPGVYRFPSSANLQVNGTLTLDFQGNSDALFIFQLGSTLVTMANSKIVALNPGSGACAGSNVYWAVGSSATINGSEFIGTVIAATAITMTSAGNTPPVSNVDGRMFALGASVTMVNSAIAICPGGGTVPPPATCGDYVTGCGSIDGNLHGKKDKNEEATFAVSGGIKRDKFWGELSLDTRSNRVKIKGKSVTSYLVIDEVTRQIEGTASLNGKGTYKYTVIVVDNVERGHKHGPRDSFSLELSNGFSISGDLKDGNIQIHNN